MRNLILFFSLMVGMASAALADDDIEEVPVEEKTYFQGLYGGLGVAVSNFENDVSALDTINRSTSGVAVKYFLGYRRYISENFLLGLEGQLIITNDDLIPDDASPFGLLEGYGNAILKLGYSSNDRFMIYGGVGYGFSDLDRLEDRASFDSEGLVVEAGFEYMPISWLGFRAFVNLFEGSRVSPGVTTFGGALFLSF